MVAGTIDIGYQGYIYTYLDICLFFFISHCVPFEPVLDDFFLFESNLWQTFYRDKISI